MIGILLFLILLTMLLGPSFMLSAFAWILGISLVLAILGGICWIVYEVITGIFDALSKIPNRVWAIGLCLFCGAILVYALFTSHF